MCMDFMFNSHFRTTDQNQIKCCAKMLFRIAHSINAIISWISNCPLHRGAFNFNLINWLGFIRNIHTSHWKWISIEFYRRARTKSHLSITNIPNGHSIVCYRFNISSKSSVYVFDPLVTISHNENWMKWLFFYDWKKLDKYLNWFFIKWGQLSALCT